LHEELPDALYEPGRSQLTVRVPEDAAEQFPALVAAADALLNVVSGAAPTPV
jgi:transcription-repair coupling factor (superfamily II helicase)